MRGFRFLSAEDEAPRRTREKKTSGTKGICPTVRREILGGSKFCDFFSNLQK